MLLLVVQSVGTTPTKATIEGVWLWKGPGGWQRITLELKATGKRVSFLANPSARVLRLLGMGSTIIAQAWFGRSA